MRVLHLAAGNLYGGVETILVSLARYRDLCPDMESCFGVCYEGRLADELRRAGCPVVALGRARLSRPWTVLAARRRLRDLLADGPWDAVVCHMVWPLIVFGPAVRRADKRLAFWLHNPTNGSHWTEKWAKLTPPDVVIAVSRHTGATAANLFPRTPAVVCYAPLPPSSASPPGSRDDLRRQLGAAPEDVVILQASRMEAWKGHKQHVEALGLLRDVPGWVCWMAGGAQKDDEADYLRGLQRSAAELGIADRVKFLGQRGDVLDLMGAADVYCQPNLGSEGFSIAFLEACLAGLPIVTSALGGAMEIVDDTTGIPVPTGDVKAVAAAIAALVGDPARRAALGRGAKARARALSDPRRQMLSLRAVLLAERTS